MTMGSREIAYRAHKKALDACERARSALPPSLTEYQLSNLSTFVAASDPKRKLG